MGPAGSTFEGKTLDEAVRKGLEALGLSRAEASITVVEEGSGGFLGFGARPFKVRVMARPGGAIRDPANREDDDRRSRDRGGRGRDRGGRGRDRGRGGERRGGRPDEGRREESGAPAAAGGRSDREGRGDRGRGRGRGDDRRRDEREQPAVAGGGRPGGEERGERGEREGRGDRGRRFERGSRGGRDDRGRADEARPATERAPMAGNGREQPAPRPAMAADADRVSPSEGEGGRRRRRRRGRRGGAGRGEGTGEGAVGTMPLAADAVMAGPAHADEPMGFDDGGDFAGDMPEPRETAADEPAAAEPARASGRPRRERSGGAPPRAENPDSGEMLTGDALAAEGKRWTGQLLTMMGFEASLRATADGDRVTVVATIEDGENLLAGERDEVRQAMQQILNRMINRGEGSRYHLQFEINDFWEKRETELRALAQRLAAEALEKNGEALTDYLNSQERRIIHVTLREDTRVKTYALGIGHIKRLAVAPADYPGGPAGES